MPILSSARLLFTLPFPSPKHSIKTKFPYFSSIRMSSTTIEHVVLFKVKQNTDPAKINTMITSLNGLVSLDPVLHLSAGQLHRVKSSPIPFTHMLHSRYSSKDNLNAYSAHPSHVSVVKENVLPICDDVMAVDWVADNDDIRGHVVPPPGSALRVALLKLKENLEGKEVKSEILAAMRGSYRGNAVKQITCGENFSPARAKGYSIASIAVFEGPSEMDSEEETVNLQQEKVRDYLESVIAVDYVLPYPQSASL